MRGKNSLKFCLEINGNSDAQTFRISWGGLSAPKSLPAARKGCLKLDRDFCWRLCQSECKGVTAGDQGSGGTMHCVTAKLPSDVLQAVRFR